MKRLYCLTMIVIVSSLIFLPTGSTFAQTSKILMTYPGDTKETIARRAEWIEGARKEGMLIWWGTRQPAEAKAIISEFTKIYPFIKVDYWRGRAAALSSKLEASVTGGIYPVDIVLGGGHENYPRWRKMGLMERFIDIVPGIDKMDKRLYSKHGDWLMTGNTVMGINYNTKLVSAAEAPKSWEDMLDPKWKGQICLATSVLPWVTLALGDGGWGVDKVEAILNEIVKQDIRWQRSNTTAHALLVAGEHKINVGGFLHHVLKSQKAGAPVDWSRINPLLIQGSALHLQKKRPNPNAAMLFVEWLFSPDGIIFFEKVTGKGAAFPGSGTKQAELVEGLDLVVASEETTLKALEISLYDRYYKALGIVR